MGFFENPRWEALKALAQPGDELWRFYDTDDFGHAGLVLIRGDEDVAKFYRWVT